ncbi:MAG: transcription factor IIA subunit alpha [Alyxoria varia]|nr:MAG: transcription factor IIA subunit alpha [Alyxoria varia]
MSNTAVGGLYNRIIDQVIEVSKNDFEENGVDSKTIDMFKQTWQNHLTQLARADFPWEEKPKADPKASESSAGPSNSQNASNQAHQVKKQPSATPAPQGAPSSSTPASAQPSNGGGARVKQEPGAESTSPLNMPQASNMPQATYNSNPQYAHQRALQAVQHAQQQMGGQAMNGPNAYPSSNGAMGQNQQYPASAQQQQQQQQQMPKIKQEATLEGAQHDGPASAASKGTHHEQWQAVIERKNARGEYEPMGRVNADRIVRRHAQALQAQLEGGGVMVPLDERYPRHQQRAVLARQHREVNAGKGKAKGKQVATDDDVEGGSPSSAAPPHPPPPAQLDGNLEDEDEDIKDIDDGEDAINSDLDDSEDELNEGIEGNEFEGDTILCLYDKVQRVKNKWKCTLKDGVVTVAGRDYVFHKANGEFEW